MGRFGFWLVVILISVGVLALALLFLVHLLLNNPLIR